jgi:hypothetical protein
MSCSSLVRKYKYKVLGSCQDNPLIMFYRGVSQTRGDAFRGILKGLTPLGISPLGVTQLRLIDPTVVTGLRVTPLWFTFAYVCMMHVNMCMFLYLLMVLLAALHTQASNLVL